MNDLHLILDGMTPEERERLLWAVGGCGYAEGYLDGYEDGGGYEEEDGED